MKAIGRMVKGVGSEGEKRMEGGKETKPRNGERFRSEKERRVKEEGKGVKDEKKNKGEEHRGRKTKRGGERFRREKKKS